MDGLPVSNPIPSSISISQQSLRRASAVVLVLSALIGLLVPERPEISLIVLAIAMISIATCFPDVTRVAFIYLLSVSILGYILFSRGFAYLGVRPIYLGEALLLLGVVAVFVSHSKLRIPPVGWLLIAFIGFAAARTVPFLGQYGLDALRDAALWYYASFALIVCMLASSADFERVSVGVAKLLPIALLALLISNLLWAEFLSAGPLTFRSEIPFFFVKNTDRGAVLASIAAFLILRLDSNREGGTRSNSLCWLLWFGSLPWILAGTRGGTLAIFSSLLTVFVIRLDLKAFVKPFFAAVLTLIPLVIANPTFGIGSDRPISISQFTENLVSIVRPEDAEAGLAGTRDYRLDWWSEIFSYTFGGEFFLTGKGFGINLADDDGFQTAADSSLRAPHNSHLTVLARMGVPGFALWVGLQAVFGVLLLRSIQTTTQQNDRAGAAFRIWVLATWIAMIVVTSFDPFLEGPQGAIPFWCVFGLGLIGIRDTGRPPVFRPRSRFSSHAQR